MRRLYRWFEYRLFLPFCERGGLFTGVLAAEQIEKNRLLGQRLQYPKIKRIAKNTKLTKNDHFSIVLILNLFLMFSPISTRENNYKYRGNRERSFVFRALIIVRSRRCQKPKPGLGEIASRKDNFSRKRKNFTGKEKYPTLESFVSFPSLVKFADDVRKSDKKAEEREKEEKRTTTSTKNIDQERGKTGREKDRTDERDFSGNWSWTEDISLKRKNCATSLLKNIFP